MPNKNKILFISGPTAIGKSSFAIEIANYINGEIINADSMQVYKELKILTARPQKDDLKKINHHLYGHRNGDLRYNVFDWCKDCTNKIIDITSKKKLPIIVGGTGLYFLSIINGISKIPHIPEKIKKESNLLLKKLGWETFFELTKKIDKESCLKIKKNDSQRLKRIWEVFFFTKIPLSEWNKREKKYFIKDYKYKLLLILPEQKKVYQKSDQRVLQMIKNGAIEEVKNLLKKNYDSSLPIMKAHGVPEINKYLNNKTSYEDMVNNIQKNTRNYVKRQLTWWRGNILKSDQLFDDFPYNINPKKLNILKKFTN